MGGDVIQRRDAHLEIGRRESRALPDRLDLPAEIGIVLAGRSPLEEARRQIAGAALQRSDRLGARVAIR